MGPVGGLTLDAPYRAHDTAVVPIRIEPAFPQTGERHIKTVTLCIDENPLPVASRFHFTPVRGRAALGTRVRVNACTHSARSPRPVTASRTWPSAS